MRLLAFARALLARWDRRVLSPRPLGLVFRQPPAPRPTRAARAEAGQGNVTRNVHVHVQPNIALTVVRPAGEAATSRIRELVPGSSTVERSLDATHELVLRNTSVLAAGPIVERVLSRSRRVDVLVRQGPAGRDAALAGRPAPPPPLVVHHGARPDTPVALPRREASQAAQAATGVSASAGVDLARVTDHVVSAIDTRLAAHAERLGRG